MRNSALAVLLVLLATCAAAAEPGMWRDYPFRSQISVSYSLDVHLPYDAQGWDNQHKYINTFCDEFRDFFSDPDGLGTTSCNGNRVTVNGLSTAIHIRLNAPESFDTDAVLAELRKFPFETLAILERQETSIDAFKVASPNTSFNGTPTRALRGLGPVNSNR